MDRDFDANEVLQLPLFAHLASGSPDGARESPVWFLWEDGELWLVGNRRDTFPKRLEADPRCAVGIVDFDLQRGWLRHVGIRGTASVMPLDPARLHRLLAKYLGADPARWNPQFKTAVIDRLDLMVRIAPTSIVARDQSYFK
jgi:hypothetical protein